jgi:hypothetical protein
VDSGRAKSLPTKMPPVLISLKIKLPLKGPLILGTRLWGISRKKIGIHQKVLNKDLKKIEMYRKILKSRRILLRKRFYNRNVKKLNTLISKLFLRRRKLMKKV